MLFDVRSHLLVALADPYETERVRLIMAGDPTWVVQPVEASDVFSRTFTPPTSGALLAPLDLILSLASAAFPMPVLAVGTPSAFDMVPAGLCDDLIDPRLIAGELRYRLRRIVRPAGMLSGGNVIVCEPLRLVVDNRSVALTPTEYRVMVMLLRGRGETVPRAALEGATRGRIPSGSRALEMHISRLRGKLRAVTEGLPDSPRIVAHRRSGYALA